MTFPTNENTVGRAYPTGRSSYSYIPSIFEAVSKIDYISDLAKRTGLDEGPLAGAAIGNDNGAHVLVRH